MKRKDGYYTRRVCLSSFGLNESYAYIGSQILMQDPLPYINKVFSLLIQEEKQGSLTSIVLDPKSFLLVLVIFQKEKETRLCVLTVAFLVIP